MNTLILLSRKKVLNSLINKANNIGLKLQPWRKPNGISKISDSAAFVFTTPFTEG